MRKHGTFSNLKWALRRAVISGAIVAFAISVSGCALLPKEEDVLPPPLTEPPKAEYEWIAAEMGPIEAKINGSGQFVSTDRYDLSYSNGGRLKAVHVKQLDMVKKGQVLIELENEGLERSLKKMEIDLKNQELDFNNSKVTLNAQIEQDKAKLADLKKQLAEKTAPGMQDLVAAKEIDDLKKAIKDQEALIKKDQDNYNYQVTRLSNNLAKARLDYNYTKQDYDKSRIVSPINGQVTSIKNDLRIGGYVDANQMVIQVSDPSKVLLSYQDDNAVQYFNLNTKVDVEVNGARLKGEVVQTPTTLAAGGNPSMLSTVYIRVDGLKNPVKSGDHANISLVLDRNEKAVIIPRAFLQTPSGRTFVWVLDEEQQVKKERDVEVGINNGTEVEIKKGLEEGEKVVAS